MNLVPGMVSGQKYHYRLIAYPERLHIIIGYHQTVGFPTHHDNTRSKYSVVVIHSCILNFSSNEIRLGDYIEWLVEFSWTKLEVCLHYLNNIMTK